MLLLQTAQDAITLADDELPETLGTFGGDLVGEEHVSSDGSKLLIRTGNSPGNIAVTGDLRWTDAAGNSPLQRALRLDAMRLSLLPVTVTIVPDDAAVQGVSVVLAFKTFTYLVLGLMQVRYQMDLVNELQGGLAAVGLAGRGTAQTGTILTVSGGTALAAQVGPQTAAAMGALTALLPSPTRPAP